MADVSIVTGTLIVLAHLILKRKQPASINKQSVDRIIFPYTPAA